jgi:thiol-disulfide isomerase/thioredoxin
MKKRQFISKVLSVSAAYAATSLIANEAVAKEPAPVSRVQGKLLDGSAYSLAGREGKVTLVHFWATWCGTCIEGMPDVQAYYDSQKAKGVAMVSIAVDDAAKDVRDWLKKKPFAHPFAWEGDMKHNFGRIGSIPRIFVIGKDGRVAKKFVGEMDEDDFAEITALI